MEDTGTLSEKPDVGAVMVSEPCLRLAGGVAVMTNLWFV